MKTPKKKQPPYIHPPDDLALGCFTACLIFGLAILIILLAWRMLI